MHDRHLVHGDICSHNVRVTYRDEPRCTIIDLGRSVVRDEGLTVYGTRGWQAPEVVGRDTRLARERAEMLDVWALGVTMCCMVAERMTLTENQDEVMGNCAREVRAYSHAARAHGWHGAVTVVAHGTVPGEECAVWRALAQSLQYSPADRGSVQSLIEQLDQ
eukprot:649652-Rhodomonas_salina.1